MHPVATGALAGAVASLSLKALRANPPGGTQRWERTNHAGRPVTLLEGPAYAVGAADAAGLSGAGRDLDRAPPYQSCLGIAASSSSEARTWAGRAERPAQ